MLLEQREQLPLFFSDMTLQQITEIEDQLRRCRGGFELGGRRTDLLMILDQLVDHRPALRCNLAQIRKQHFLLGTKMGDQVAGKKIEKFSGPFV